MSDAKCVHGISSTNCVSCSVDAKWINRIDKLNRKLAAAEQRVTELEAANAVLFKQLQAFTPGGSEFTETHECLRWIRGKLDSGHAAKIENVKLRRANAELVEGLRVFADVIEAFSERADDTPLEVYAGAGGSEYDFHVSDLRRAHELVGKYGEKK